eukprot:7056427-Prymnesium_polylepis.1
MEADKPLMRPSDGKHLQVDLDEARRARKDARDAQFKHIACGHWQYRRWRASWRRSPTFPPKIVHVPCKARREVRGIQVKPVSDPTLE